MKKAVIPLIFCLFPIVASAAWWNPASWPVFHRSKVEYHAPIVAPATNTASIINATSTTIIEDNSATAVIVSTTTEAEKTTENEALKKKEPVRTVKSVGVTDAQSAIWQKQVQDQINAQKAMQEKQAEEAAEAQKEAQREAQKLLEKQQEALERQKKAEAKRIQKEKELAEKPCNDAKAAVAELKKKEAGIKKEYANKIANAKKNSEGTYNGGLEQEIDRIERDELSELSDLAIEQISANNEYNLECENYTGSSMPTYTPPVTTYCENYGGLVKCTSY